MGRIYTIGHSTRPLEEFMELLKSRSIAKLIDVRTIPRSRRNPQYNIETLPKELERNGIRYLHLKSLGGLRSARKDSVNTGWRNASFRGFADYMQTEGFDEGIKALMSEARTGNIAIMCAEALPWRCHRSLIADALTLRRRKVFHIISGKKDGAHVLTPFAEVQGREIIYPGGNGPDNKRGRR